MSGHKLPTLGSDASAEIDQFLKRTGEKRVVPAVFLGVTNAEQTLYSNQNGEKVFGEPDKGIVTENTGTLSSRGLLSRFLTCFLATEMYSQTKFVTCVSHPTLGIRM